MRNRLKWAGHVERMEGERLWKVGDALMVEGRRDGSEMGSMSAEEGKT